MNSIAIIPARGGSKRIPRKNVRAFNGLPIIAYSIKAAVDSGCFNEIIVSTDSEEIATIAQQYGAHVPFLRSTETSDDYATTSQVISEVLQQYESSGKVFSYACCIYATAPFITGEKLHKARLLLEGGNCTAVVPVVRFSYPVQRSLRMEGDHMSFANPEFALSRSQDLEPRFHDAGQFYWFDVAAFKTEGSLFMARTIGMELPESEVQDIDTELDWKLAEIKHKLLAKASNV